MAAPRVRSWQGGPDAALLEGVVPTWRSGVVDENLEIALEAVARVMLAQGTEADLDALLYLVGRLPEEVREAEVVGRIERVLEGAGARRLECAACGKAILNAWSFGGIHVGPCCVEGWPQGMAEALSPADPEVRHATEGEVAEARDVEPECAIHPCDDWRSWMCMCKGSCSCHWRRKEGVDHGG